MQSSGKTDLKSNADFQKVGAVEEEEKIGKRRNERAMGWSGAARSKNRLAAQAGDKVASVECNAQG